MKLGQRWSWSISHDTDGEYKIRSHSELYEYVHHVGNKYREDYFKSYALADVNASTFTTATDAEIIDIVLGNEDKEDTAVAQIFHAMLEVPTIPCLFWNKAGCSSLESTNLMQGILQSLF